jgi:Na+-translocating ferredoxin:NAD+ oxidoreductase RnfA subunit
VIFVYLLVVTILKRTVPRVLSRIQRILSLAAFNNVLIGLLMITEFSLNTSLWGALGAAVGAALDFFLLSRFVEEALGRLDNPEMPAAFKGFPIALLYLGLLALAFSGFKPAITLL